MDVDVKNNKDSKFELLRIFAMILIILSHLSIHGSWMNLYAFDISHIYLQFLRIFGGIGNILFFMITGYFMINPRGVKFKSSHIKKALYITFKTTLYSVLILLLFFLFAPEYLTASSAFKSFFPILFQTNWFASTYIFLCILSPFINMFIFSLTKNNLKLLVVILIVGIAGVSLSGINIIYDNLRWAILFYTIGGAMNIYNFKEKLYKRKSYVINFLLLLVSIVVVLAFASIYPNLGPKVYSFYYEMQRLSVLIISLGIFSFVLNHDLNNSKTINCIATSCFGVYLIHDNIFVREWLWKTIMQIIGSSVEYSILLFFYSLFIAISVFVVCLIIDKILYFVFNSFLNRISDVISKLCDPLIERFSKVD